MEQPIFLEQQEIESSVYLASLRPDCNVLWTNEKYSEQAAQPLPVSRIIAAPNNDRDQLGTSKLLKKRTNGVGDKTGRVQKKGAYLAQRPIPYGHWSKIPALRAIAVPIMPIPRKPTEGRT